MLISVSQHMTKEIVIIFKTPVYVPSIIKALPRASQGADKINFPGYPSGEMEPFYTSLEVLFNGLISSASKKSPKYYFPITHVTTCDLLKSSPVAL